MNRVAAYRRCKESILTARYNQIYHASYVLYWQRVNTGIKITVAILALLGMVAAFSGWADLVNQIIAGVSLFCAILLNIIPTESKENLYLSLYHRYTYVRKSLESIELSVLKSNANTASADILKRLDELAQELVSIQADEPAQIDEKFMRQCQAKVRQSALGGKKLAVWIEERKADLFPQEATDNLPAAG